MCPKPLQDLLLSIYRFHVGHIWQGSNKQTSISFIQLWEKEITCYHYTCWSMHGQACNFEIQVSIMEFYANIDVQNTLPRSCMAFSRPLWFIHFGPCGPKQIDRGKNRRPRNTTRQTLHVNGCRRQVLWLALTSQNQITVKSVPTV